MRTRRTAVPKLQQCAASADGNGNNIIYYILLGLRHSHSLYTALPPRRRDRRSTSVTRHRRRHCRRPWVVGARAASLFVCKWARKLVSRRYLYTHFYLSPGALLLFLYACLYTLASRRRGRKKKKKKTDPSTRSRRLWHIIAGPDAITSVSPSRRPPPTRKAERFTRISVLEVRFTATH